MVDVPSIESRLHKLGQLVNEMTQIALAGREAYDGDFRAQLAAQHAIQQAIQVCIDISAHLIAELGLSVPPDYRGVFDKLPAADFDRDLISRLADATGMRNILVHGYLDVDDDIVWDALFELDDLREFATSVERLITRLDS